MLKSFSQVDKDAVTNYLIDNYVQMPRTAYRYALEKYDKETRKRIDVFIRKKFRFSDLLTSRNR